MNKLNLSLTLSIVILSLYFDFSLLSISSISLFSFIVLSFFFDNSKSLSLFSLYQSNSTTVQSNVSVYNKISNIDQNNKNNDSKKDSYQSMVSSFYNIVTDFYEYGWGESFHFAPRYKNESFRQALARHEHYVAMQLGLKPGMKVLDLGAGVGGPMREIARFSGATVVGVNIVKYQIERGNIKNKEYGMENLCSFVEADFHKLPFEDNTFDAAYCIEASCHSPDELKLFTEINRVLKPNAKFASYEWCLTDNFKAENKEHKKLIEDIEFGNGLPELKHTSHSIDCLRDAGFKVNHHKDLAQMDKMNTVLWSEPLKPSLTNFRSTAIGSFLTMCFCYVLEKLRIAPKGSTDTARILFVAGTALEKSSRENIFTPCFFICGTKQ